MINILDTTEKKKILTEYRFRLASVSIFAVAALVTVSLILLVPTYMLAVSKNNNAEKDLAVLKEKYGSGGKEKDISTQIRDANNKISLLSNNDTNARLSPSQVVLNILKIKGSTIKIYGFTYDSVVNQERIVLVGRALDRDSLASFVEILKRDPTFTNITLPISSYVKSTNIDFSIVIERSIKPPAKK